MGIRSNVKNAYARTHLSSDLLATSRGRTFPPPCGHVSWPRPAAVFHAAAGASPSPTLLPRNKRANNVRFGFEKHKQPQHALRALSYHDRRPVMADCPPARRGGWRRPWRTVAPGWDGGDSGRAAVADGVAPVVGEGGRGGVAVTDGGSRGGRRRRWRMEATRRGWRRPWSWWMLCRLMSLLYSL